MLTPDEISLLELIKSGDREAFKTLYTSHFTILVRVAVNLSGETVHAKDAVQNVFVQFWNKRQSIQITTGILPYLRRMVIHEVLAMKRKSSRRTTLFDRRPTAPSSHNEPEELLQRKETEAAIRAAIDALPDRCSEIFKLSRYSEMSYAEIAEALDISVKTVENQMGRALRELRSNLRPE
jgi:RNA polymerase sigma-70 factor (ECF subfamily)